ncbi:NAD(P)/FAD-dependent oxidoreductase [Sporosarcina pasteurii]|uniref:Ferredoxin--NADP reductase n=1 Tax=Sporosarcina pasteurii TaxID=1474 RepID=A0A380C5L3_SPOPA|nr:NAD(P)/FAD-dependent oxidoreductase [Sporosarcina pasteurii]MDS9471703.1 NAD(P)/FAD-dependent oxidoreductase [Sporosarcina pasteurii]QBQ04696.1 NAD(P)/FAD-dependent oxidoreductase [Sporosarcina pasteurii]SUJ12212.1 Ferredoxin--NADP reductase 2 [Sporosarcina pasteurii]
MEREIVDITIIGGGPTGLFASFYAGMREMSVKIIDSLPQLGGQLIELYPDKYIYDVGGFPKILAKDFVANLVTQAHYANPEILLGETALSVVKHDDYYELKTDKGVHLTRTILLTVGIGAFQPRKIGLKEEAQFEGKTLHYGIKDLTVFKDKNIVVCGGGDSAVDWALMLEDIASSVTLIHRRERFTAHETSVNQLMDSKVEVKTSLSIKEIIGENGEVNELLVASRDGNEERISTDHVIVNYGNISSLGPLKEWGLEMERNSILVNTKMETNMEGIYAAGDVTTFDGKVKLIAVGLGEAPIAVNHAKAYIDPKARLQPLHSTSVFS